METITVPAGYGKLFKKIAEQVQDLIDKDEVNVANTPYIKDTSEQGIADAHNAITGNAAYLIVCAKQVEDLL